MGVSLINSVPEELLFATFSGIRVSGFILVPQSGVQVCVCVCVCVCVHTSVKPVQRATMTCRKDPLCCEFMVTELAQSGSSRIGCYLDNQVPHPIIFFLS